MNIKEIRARAEAASPGPWVCCTWDPMEPPHVAVQSVIDKIKVCDSRSNVASPADAEFIAHAREDIPALIARVEELEAALKSKFSVCPGPEAMLVCEDREAMGYFINGGGPKACHPHNIVLRAQFEAKK